MRTADGFEVDFLARYPAGKPELIQVCADLDLPETRQRETRGLLAAAGEHPQASLHLVALNIDLAAALPDQVRLHSAAAWFMRTGDEAT